MADKQTTGLRKVERHIPYFDIWATINFTDLKQGDRFRMWKPTGEPVYLDHIQVMLATSDPYKEWFEDLQREEWAIDAKAA